jgi:hypothetical protein
MTQRVPSTTRTVVLGLMSAGIVMAALFAFGRVGGGNAPSATLQEIDPSLAAFRGELATLSEQLEGRTGGTASGPVPPYSAAPTAPPAKDKTP